MHDDGQPQYHMDETRVNDNITHKKKLISVPVTKVTFIINSFIHSLIHLLAMK